MMTTLQITLLAALVGQSSAGVCATDADYAAAHIAVYTCNGLNKTKCVGLPLEWSNSENKCEVKFSTFLGHSKADGTELKAACEAKGGTIAGPIACSSYMTLLYPKGFVANVTTCGEKSATGGLNSQMTSYMRSAGCCGTGADACSTTAFKVCKTGFKANRLAQVECGGLTKAECANGPVGVDFDNKEPGVCRVNARSTTADVIKACTDKSGYVAKTPTSCGMYATMFGGKTDKATCAATSMFNAQWTNAAAAKMVAETMGCCDSGSTLCCDDANFCVVTTPETTSSATGATGAATSRATGATGAAAVILVALHALMA